MDTAAIRAFAISWSPRLLSLLRIVLAALFLFHGVVKIFGVPAGAMPGQVPLASLFGVAGLLELVGGALLLIGLFTRSVAFLLSGEMAFAYFIGHAGKGFWPAVNGGEAAVMYCFAFLYFSAAGAGPWSLDAGRRS